MLVSQNTEAGGGLGVSSPNYAGPGFSEDFEDLMTRSDPEFWRMIEARRKASKTISASEMRRRLGVTKKPSPKRKR